MHFQATYIFFFLFSTSGSDLQRRGTWDGASPRPADAAPARSNTAARQTAPKRAQSPFYFFPAASVQAEKNSISSLFQLILRLLHSIKAEALIKPGFSLLSHFETTTPQLRRWLWLGRAGTSRGERSGSRSHQRRWQRSPPGSGRTHSSHPPRPIPRGERWGGWE